MAKNFTDLKESHPCFGQGKAAIGCIHHCGGVTQHHQLKEPTI